MNFLRRPGPSSLPKGLFPTPKVQTVVANAWHATSSAAKDVFECLKCLQDLSTFETVILQESHLLHWWLLLAMQPKQCREDGHRSCRWNGSQETSGYLNTKSFFMFLYSFFSFFYFVCPYLVVCLFPCRSAATSWPPVGPATNSSLSMDRPERTGPTSNKPKEILPRKMFPPFFR